MHRESSDGPGRRIGMFQENKPAFGLETFISDGNAAAEIRPPVPGPLLNGPKKIGSTPHWPAAPLIITIIGYKKLLAQERESEGIAQAPGNELRLASLGSNAQH